MASTITSTGSITSLLSLQQADFAAAKNTGITYFATDGVSDFNNIDESNYSITSTSSTVTGIALSGDGSFHLKGSRFFTASATLTHVDYADSTGHFSFDGSLSLKPGNDFPTGSLTSIEAMSGNDGFTYTGRMTLDAANNITGTLTKEVVHMGGLTFEMTGSLNITTETGTVSKLYIHDDSGNGLTLTGNYSFAAIDAALDGTGDVGNFFENNSFLFTSDDTLTVSDGAREWHGYEGRDKMTGGGLDDTLSGDNGNDTLTGLLGNDHLNGGAGDDTMDGGAGDDSMAGGTGNDVYLVDSSNDDIAENSGEGNDTVKSTASFDLSLHGLNVESLTLLGTAHLDATGNDLNNTLTGNTGNNHLDGGIGADKMMGGAGNDVYIVDNSGDTLTDTSGTDEVDSSISWTLATGFENLVLTGGGDINATGNTANNSLTGNSGNNTLNGGTGNDTMSGGLGDDTYVVSAAGDIIHENSGEGRDTVLAAASYHLGDNLEVLQLTGTSAINGYGNELDNTLTGNSGNNTLDGGAGNDTLIGGSGNDSYVVHDFNTTTIIENAGGGTDTLLLYSDYNLTDGSNIENMTAMEGGHTMVGNSFVNTITGTSGIDLLDGGAGADKLSGLGGNDEYFADNVKDLLVEGANGGTDLVHSTVDWTLGANFENLSISGVAVKGTGNTVANVITGSIGDNTLNGMAGDDTLNGNGGHDTLIGGTGADTFQLLHTSANAFVTVTDFSHTAHDKLDISDLLTGGFDPAHPENYVQLQVIGADTHVSIDASGSGAAFTEVAVLLHATGLTLDTMHLQIV